MTERPSYAEMSGFSPARGSGTTTQVRAFFGAHGVCACLAACGSCGEMVEASRQETGRGLGDGELVLVGVDLDAVDDVGAEAEHGQAHGLSAVTQPAPICSGQGSLGCVAEGDVGRAREFGAVRQFVQCQPVAPVCVYALCCWTFGCAPLGGILFDEGCDCGFAGGWNSDGHSALSQWAA